MTQEISDISGSVVVVTGAARGIGFATAQLFLRRGAKVAICDIDGADIAQAAATLGAHAHEVLDVTDSARFAAFLDDVEEQLGPIDVLVNNAGICPAGSFLEESNDLTTRIIAINLTAVIVGTRLAVARMGPRRRGHVINLSSLAGVIAEPGVATYTATKHGVLGFSDAARIELRGSGINISTVLPGVTDTRMMNGVGAKSRMPKAVNPTAVAEVIVELVEHPAPRRIVGRLLAFSIGMSERVFSRRTNEFFRRVIGADQVCFDGLDRGQRADYEEVLRNMSTPVRAKKLPFSSDN